MTDEQPGEHEQAIVAPTREDPLVASLSESIGGPLGDHAGRHRWWTPVRVILALTAIVFALGMVQKTTCYDQSWMNSDARYSHMCYSDLPYLYVDRGLAELRWPFSDNPVVRAKYQVMEYPVGIAYWAWGAAWVTHWLDGSPDVSHRYSLSTDQIWALPDMLHEVRLYVIANAVGFAALALLAAWFLANTDRRRPWDAAAFALSPALLLTGIINWDMLAVVFVAGALWAWARGRPVLTGILIGIGTAAKLYPAFLVGALLILCIRQKRMTDFAGLVSAGFLAWVLVDLPGLLTGPAQWKVFWSFNSTRGADLGSIWIVVQQMTGKTFTSHGINTASWLVFALWCAGVLLLGLMAKRMPTFAQLGFLVLVGFLLTNKVYSPQYVLWLLPLAALARPRWRDQLIWQTCEVAYFAAVWWYLGGELEAGGGSQQPFYWILVGVRVAGELYIAAQVVRDVLRAPAVVEEVIECEPLPAV